MSNKINKINVGGVEYTLPSGSTAHVEGSALYINNSGSGSSSGGSGSGGSGGTGTVNVFEDVTELPKDPDGQKIYKIRNYGFVLGQPSGVSFLENGGVFEGLVVNILPVTALPDNPVPTPSTINGNLTLTIYVLDEEIYGYPLTDGVNNIYSWVKNTELVTALSVGVSYGGLITDHINNITPGTLYLAYYEKEYINIPDDSKTINEENKTKLASDYKLIGYESMSTIINNNNGSWAFSDKFVRAVRHCIKPGTELQLVFIGNTGIRQINLTSTEVVFSGRDNYIAVIYYGLCYLEGRTPVYISIGNLTLEDSYLFDINPSKFSFGISDSNTTAFDVFTSVELHAKC